MTLTWSLPIWSIPSSWMDGVGVWNPLRSSQSSQINAFSVL
jgi:hypothetical protein